MIRRPPTSSLFLYSTSFRFFFNDTATTEIYTLSLHDALPISALPRRASGCHCHVPGQIWSYGGASDTALRAGVDGRRQASIPDAIAADRDAGWRSR